MARAVYSHTIVSAIQYHIKYGIHKGHYLKKNVMADFPKICSCNVSFLK